MERDGRELDPAVTAPAMAPYAAAGLTTFDMADHYGSAEIIAGTFHKTNPNCQLLTKSVPKPGPVTREQVRTPAMPAPARLQLHRIDLMQFPARRLSPPPSPAPPTLPHPP